MADSKIYCLPFTLLNIVTKRKYSAIKKQSILCFYLGIIYNHQQRTDLENKMQIFYKFLTELQFCIFNNFINATEVGRCFDNIINTHLHRLSQYYYLKVYTAFQISSRIVSYKEFDFSFTVDKVHMHIVIFKRIFINC